MPDTPCLSVIFSIPALVLSMVAWLGGWFHGDMDPDAWDGRVSGEGVVGIGGIHSGRFYSGAACPTEEICGKFQVMTGLVITAIALTWFTIFAALGGKCCQDGHCGKVDPGGLRHFLAAAVFATGALGCMGSTVALAVSMDVEHMMRQFQGFGVAFYCACANILLEFGVATSMFMVWCRKMEELSEK